MRPQSNWSAVRASLAKDPRFQALDNEKMRTEIFAEYTKALNETEGARVRRGEQSFKVRMLPPVDGTTHSTELLSQGSHCVGHPSFCRH